MFAIIDKLTYLKTLLNRESPNMWAGPTHCRNREEHVGGTHPKKRKKLNTTCCV